MVKYQDKNCLYDHLLRCMITTSEIYGPIFLSGLLQRSQPLNQCYIFINYTPMKTLALVFS